MAVYLIKRHGHIHYKIGYSKNPEKRLRQLQTGNSDRLELIAILECEDRRNREIEGIIKYALRKHRLNGEWFSLHETVVDKLMSSFAWTTQGVA